MVCKSTVRGRSLSSPAGTEQHPANLSVLEWVPPHLHCTVNQLTLNLHTLWRDRKIKVLGLVIGLELVYIVVNALFKTNLTDKLAFTMHIQVSDRLIQKKGSFDNKKKYIYI